MSRLEALEAVKSELRFLAHRNSDLWTSSKFLDAMDKLDRDIHKEKGKAAEAAG